MLELRAQVDVPVGVVFEGDGGGDAFADHALGDVEVGAPGAEDVVSGAFFDGDPV